VIRAGVGAGADAGPAAAALRLDGIAQPDTVIALVDDQRTHLVELSIR
jgi:hypothetical protein